MRIEGRVGSLSSCYPAAAEAVPHIRAAVAAYAAAVGASEEQLQDIRLVVSEAVTNVVQHAYDDAHGAVLVTASEAADELWILVADEGSGLSTDKETAGLGLGMAWMSDFSDELTLHTRACGGLEVRARFDLSNRARSAFDSQLRGSLASASRPASPSFSTTT